MGVKDAGPQWSCIFTKWAHRKRWHSSYFLIQGYNVRVHDDDEEIISFSRHNNIIGVEGRLASESIIYYKDVGLFFNRFRNTHLLRMFFPKLPFSHLTLQPNPTNWGSKIN
jgi:hypothetical protein